MSSLYGRFETVMNSEGRVTLPGELATRLDSELLGWVGSVGCVKLGSRQSLGPDAIVEMDAQGVRYAALAMDEEGRVRIPDEFLAAAGFFVDAPCVLVGVGSAVELWDAERYSRYATEAFGSG